MLLRKREDIQKRGFGIKRRHKRVEKYNTIEMLDLHFTYKFFVHVLKRKFRQKEKEIKNCFSVNRN